jgi:hypothetical protein
MPAARDATDDDRCLSDRIRCHAQGYVCPERLHDESPHLHRGRNWPSELLPSFTGYSIGKWIDEDGDGRYDVLEVETRGFKGPRTFEGTGMPLHEDNATIIRERVRLERSDPGLLRIESTIIDHALTRPWTVTRVYRREAQPVWDFVDCTENNPHVLVGNEYYMISADGYLMPTKRGQPAPDLRYFNPARKAPAK